MSKFVVLMDVKKIAELNNRGAVRNVWPYGSAEAAPHRQEWNDHEALMTCVYLNDRLLRHSLPRPQLVANHRKGCGCDACI